MGDKVAIDIEKTKFESGLDLLKLYQKVSKIKGGIIRKPAEINLAYIESFLNNAIENGLSLSATFDGKVIGEIHAYTPSIIAFQHLMTDLTIVVDPDFHGRGIGRKLFESFLDTVQNELPHIFRVELYVRSTNEKNVRFYEKLGFINEGAQKDKIFNPKGGFETPQQMAWFNPNYKRPD